MLSKANASTISKASFVVMASPPNGSSARGRRRLRSSRNGGNRDACRRERDCNDFILIPVSYAGAVVRHGFAPPASFGVRLFAFERAHSSIENSLVAGFHLPTPYGSAHGARLRAISTAALTASSRFCV